MIEGVGGAAPTWQEVVEKAHQIDVMRLEFARLAWRYAQSRGGYIYDGYDTPVQFLREDAHMAWHDAVQAVCVGANLDDLADTVAAVERGDIGFDHLVVMSDLKDTLNEKWSLVSEVKLVEDAEGLNVTQFRKHAEKVRQRIDAEGFLQEQVTLAEGRRLSMRKDVHGLLWLKGNLDPAGGAVLMAALEPLAKRSGAEDSRPRDQRLADALVEFAEHGCGSAQLQVTATLETLQELPGVPAGEILSVPIAGKTLERLSCDCTLTRVVLGGESVVIDVGRGRRIVSGPGRRALNARDKTCRWPGCSRPGTWCTPHHLIPWSKGGSTDLDNQVLVCSRHHWHLHEGGWQMVTSADGRLLVIPPPAPDAHCRGPNFGNLASVTPA